MTNNGLQPPSLRSTVEPWAFPIDSYERDQHQFVFDALLRGSYQNVLEAGSAGGELTQELSRVGVHVLALDPLPSAVARNRARCSHLNNVSVCCNDLSEHLPEGPFDLILLRQVGHHLSPGETLSLCLALAERLLPGGEFLAVHGAVVHGPHQRSNEAIHKLLAASLPLEWLKGERGPGFQMDTWLKPTAA